jgi:hypothetical protein
MGARLTVSGMTKANYQLRAPPVAPAANGQGYGLFSSATLDVPSDTDASPPLHATALSADGTRVAVGNTLARFVPTATVVPSFPYVLAEIFSPTAGYDAPISPIDAATLGAWHGFQPDKDWAIKISVDPVTAGGTPPWFHQTLWAFTHANGFASLRRFDNWGLVFRWTADDDTTALSIGYKTGTAKLTDVNDFEFAIVYDSSNYVSGGGTSPDFADITFFLKPVGSTSWSEIPKAAETFDNAATDDHMFLYYPPYDNFDGTSATTWSSSGDMIGTFGPEMHGLSAISSTNACGLSSLQLWNQKAAPANFDQANFDQATAPSTGPAPHGAVTVHQQTEAGWSALGAPIYGEVDGAGVGGPGTFQLSADGARLAVTSLYGTTVHEWDGTTWQKLGATIGGGGANYITVPDVAFSDDGTRLLVASTNSGVQAYQWVSPDWVAMGGPLADPSETLPQIAMSGDGACAAMARRAATVTSPVYLHTEELQPGSYKSVPGTELGGWKGSFDYDQGVYFRFTTKSAAGHSEDPIGFPFGVYTSPSPGYPYFQIYLVTSGIYMEIYNDAVSFTNGWFAAKKTATLSTSTEYEVYVTWNAMGPGDLTAPDPSDIIIGHRAVGDAWSVGTLTGSESLNMFDSSGNTAAYFGLEGQESSMFLALNGNVSGNHSFGTMHKFALFNQYLTEALLDETLAAAEAALSDPGGVSVYDWSATSGTWTPRAALPSSTPIPSTVALNANGSRLVTTVDASYTTTGNTPYRYWGVGNAAGGTWTNNYYVFIWATFKDASGAILNDLTYYAQWPNTHFPSSLYESPSNDPANYLVHSFPSATFNDPSAHYGHRVVSGSPPYMHEQWQWNGSNPLFYVDLGEPKDVRTVQHLGADNHVMRDLIVVASHDRVNWTIVFTPPSDGAYNRIVDIPFTPETFPQDNALVYDWDTQALAWGQPGPAITVDQGASPHLSGDGGRLMVASADSADLYELDTSGASLKLFEIDIDIRQPPAGHVITHEGPRTSATAVSYTGWNGFSADKDWTLLITIQFPSPIVHDVKFFNFVDTSYSDIYGYTKNAYLWMHRASVNTLQFTWAGHPTNSLNAQLEKRLNSTSMASCVGKTVTFAFVYDSTNFRASVSSAPDSSDLKWYMTIPEDNVDWHEPATTSEFDNWDLTDGSGMTGIGDLNFGPDSSSGGTATDLILYNAALTATELPNAGLTATGTPTIAVSMSRDGTKLAIPTDADGGMVRLYDVLAYSAPATLSGTAGGNYAGGWRLHVDNAIQLQLATDGVTVYNGALTAPSFATSSDDRLKHNEKDITDALAAVRRLTPRCYDKTYKLPRNVRELRTLPTRPEAGLVAQEVQQVPELARFVTADPNGMLGVDYNSIFTYMLAAVKQLDAKVQRLKQA